ncbi:MAG: serine/threonine-protein kinase, partial [Planctomycetota bacterium]
MVVTTDSFLRLLEKSRLLDDKRLAEAREASQKADESRDLAMALVARQLLTRWQAGQLLAGRSSFFLGKYKLIDLLGSGGMGRVFVAEHITMNRPVALKIISKRLGQDPDSLEQFFSEARAVAALDHPNIVHAYDVDQEKDRYFLVMEFVEGQDLQQIVEAEGPLEIKRAADYVRQAANGLAHAHDRNMIHCDVKPANLLVNKQNVVKILDMGMSRLVGPDRHSAGEKDERLLGTVDYLAPEQAVESPSLDRRVDLYSLGCTFYFLLTGSPPFPDGTLHERILKHQSAEPRPITGLREDVPAQLVQICSRMMAKNPDDRFASAAEVSQALSDWASSSDLLGGLALLGKTDSSTAARARKTKPARSPRKSAQTQPGRAA